MQQQTKQRRWTEEDLVELREIADAVEEIERLQGEVVQRIKRLDPKGRRPIVPQCAAPTSTAA